MAQHVTPNIDPHERVDPELLRSGGESAAYGGASAGGIDHKDLSVSKSFSNLGLNVPNAVYRHHVASSDADVRRYVAHTLELRDGARQPLRVVHAPLPGQPTRNDGGPQAL